MLSILIDIGIFAIGVILIQVFIQKYQKVFFLNKKNGSRVYTNTRQRPRHPFCKKMEHDFKSFSEANTPTSEFINEVRFAQNLILETLKQNCNMYNLAIGKTKPAGSLAKGTAIRYKTEDGLFWNPDSDLVVYVNNMYPEDVAQVYEDFKEILQTINGVGNLKILRYSMSFTFKLPTQGIINVDLLAATNRVVDANGCDDVAAEEAKRALSRVGVKQRKSIDRINTIDMEVNRQYSASFALQTVDIIQDCLSESVIRDVVKLAKLWCAQIEYPQGSGRIRPRSCMIEVIVICAQNDSSYKPYSVVAGFVNFLEAMTKLNTLDMDIKDREIDWEYTKPMIVDPVNRYNNLADGLNTDSIKKLMNKARKTLAEIRKLTPRNKYEHCDDPIGKIFGV